MKDKIQTVLGNHSQELKMEKITKFIQLLKKNLILQSGWNGLTELDAHYKNGNLHTQNH